MTEFGTEYSLGCHLKYQLAETSTLVSNVAIAPSESQHLVFDEFTCNQPVSIETYEQPVSGNRFFKLNALAGELSLTYRARVKLLPKKDLGKQIAEVPPAELPIEVMSFLYPSRYCQSDRLMQFAFAEFGHLHHGYSRVEAICNYIYNHVSYVSGSSTSMTSACDTLVERTGICRDFAHLGIAFCRALNIPARFVTGYGLELKPLDFHAWFEAYLEDGWVTFDATRLVPQSSLVRIGTGRDAADVSFATIFGMAYMTSMQVFYDKL